MTKDEALQNLAAYESANASLSHAMGMISYDGVTFAPKGSAEPRMLTMGELSRMQYELTTSEKQSETLETLYKVKDELPFVDRRRVEELYRDYAKTKKIPKDEMVDFSMHLAKSEDIWHEAKETNNYKMFEPYLQKTVDTLVKFAGYTDPGKDPYEVSLDEYERGLTVEKCDAFFKTLRERIVPLFEKVKAAKQIDTSPLFRYMAKSEQEKLSEHIVDIMDVDRDYFTIAETEHPFTTNFTKKDVRITTHYYENAFASSLYSVVHETGHALYELHTGDELYRTCLGEGVSMGIHESQSRFYENIIGRSRAFCNMLFPYMKEHCKEQFAGVDADRFYRMINAAQPSLIRTEADELTYCLHIMVRYELEKKLFRGELLAKDLPAAWNELYKEYLGVDVPNDREGVLQDSHWGGGAFGYFPSYALGSAYGAQYLMEMKKDLDVDAVIASGKLTRINNWLEERIWKYGCLYSPTDLFNRVCGSFDPTCYTDYLEKKYTEIYNL